MKVGVSRQVGAAQARRLMPLHAYRHHWITTAVILGAVILMVLRLGWPRLPRPSAPELAQVRPSPEVLEVLGAGLAASLAFSTDQAGMLEIVQRGTATKVATGLGSAVYAADGRLYRFPDDFIPADPRGYTRTSVRDPVIGSAHKLTTTFASADGRLLTTLNITVSQVAPVLIYQLHVRALAPTEFRFGLFEQPSGWWSVRPPVDYLSLLSPGHVARRLETSGETIGLPLPAGSPLLLWSDADGRGYVIGTLDEVARPTFITATVMGPEGMHLALNSGPLAADATSSPRVYVELVSEREPDRAFAGFRALLNVLAPPPPIPPSFRHQWDSWYVYGGGIDEELIKRQIDAIAYWFGDLGPWQVVIDAGWYRAGVDPDGEIGVVDTDKFPSGMRALVDYAHARGIGVLLYAAAPWVDSRPSVQSWWVVQQGFVRKHADWLIKVAEYEDGATYVYDMKNPELRAYLDEVLRRYLVEFDADGILLDMVGIVGDEGGPLRGQPPDPSQRAIQRVAQTMDVYRFFWETAVRYKPNVWIEGAWAAPPLARRFAQTWRYGDEFPAFSNPYPFGGLLEHLTFGILQEQMLGRRTHLGFVYGDDTTWSIQRDWLAAAVALQRQVALSTDLSALPPGAVRMYREHLAALRPFSADPRYGPGIPPEWFFTQVQGTSYLGLLNPGQEPREIPLTLDDVGFPGRSHAVAFDPRSRESFVIEHRFVAYLPARSFRLLVIRSEPGVMWADRSWISQIQRGELLIRVQPGPAIGGRLWLYAGPTRAIRVDGVREPVETLTSVALVEFSDGGPHEVRLRLERG